MRKRKPKGSEGLDGEASKEGFAKSQEVPAQQWQQKAALKEYSPFISNPFPEIKFHGPSGETEVSRALSG